MAPQNSTLIQQDEIYPNDDISSNATSEKITSGNCMQDLVSDYSPILRPKSAGDRHSDRTRRYYYVENVPTTVVAGIHIPPSTQKSIFDKNIIKKGKNCDEEVCTIHNHDLILFLLAQFYIVFLFGILPYAKK